MTTTATLTRAQIEDAVQAVLDSGSIPVHRATEVAEVAGAALKKRDANAYVCMRLRERRERTGRRVRVYDPHDAAGTGGQVAFHGLPHRERYLLAAIRGGKSIAGANDLLDEISLRPSTWDEPTRWAIMTPTYKDNDRILAFTLFRYLPPDVIERKNKSAYETTLVNGAIIYGISTEHVDRIDTLPDLDGCWADEVEDMPALARLKMLGRLANRKGRFTGTTTPQKWSPTGVKRISWLYELLLERDVTVLPGQSGVVDAGDLGLVTWSLKENPHFPQEEVAPLAEKFGPALAAQELEAGYVDLEEGNTYLEEWFRDATPPKNFVQVVVSHDPAISVKGGADFSVSHVWGEDANGNYWLLEEWRDHFTFPQQVELLWDLPKRWPSASEIGIEKVAYQEALIQELQKKFREEKHPNPVRVVGHKPDKGRADRLAGQMATGRVRFADGICSKGFVNEFLAYPRWPHDDRIDAAAYGVDALRRRCGPVKVRVKRKRRLECVEVDEKENRKGKRSANDLRKRRKRSRAGRKSRSLARSPL